jgi:hypothetical protein
VCFFFIMLSYWGYIVPFTKVLVIYHNWIHPSIILPYLLSPFLEQFQQVSFFHFHTWAHNIPTTFTSYTLSLYPPPPTGTSFPDRTWFTFLFSIFKEDIFV